MSYLSRGLEVHPGAAEQQDHLVLDPGQALVRGFVDRHSPKVSDSGRHRRDVTGSNGWSPVASSMVA